jgi:hypothetical protein
MSMLWPGQHEGNNRMAPGYPLLGTSYSLACHPCCGESCDCPNPPATVDEVVTSACGFLAKTTNGLPFPFGPGCFGWTLHVTCLGGGGLGQDMDLEYQICCDAATGGWTFQYRYDLNADLNYTVFDGVLVDFQCEPTFRLEFDVTITLPAGCGCGVGNVDVNFLYEE